MIWHWVVSIPKEGTMQTPTMFDYSVHCWGAEGGATHSCFQPRMPDVAAGLLPHSDASEKEPAEDFVAWRCRDQGSYKAALQPIIGFP